MELSIQISARKQSHFRMSIRTSNGRVKKNVEVKISWHSPCSIQCFGSRWIRFFSPIRIRALKVRIWIRPCINLCDLNDGFDKVFEKPDKKVLGVLVMKYNIFSTFTLSRIRIFPDRIRFLGRSGSGLRKKVWSGSGGKKPGSQTLVLLCIMLTLHRNNFNLSTITRPHGLTILFNESSVSDPYSIESGSGSTHKYQYGSGLRRPWIQIQAIS